MHFARLGFDHFGDETPNHHVQQLLRKEVPAFPQRKLSRLDTIFSILQHLASIELHSNQVFLQRIVWVFSKSRDDKHYSAIWVSDLLHLLDGFSFRHTGHLGSLVHHFRCIIFPSFNDFHFSDYFGVFLIFHIFCKLDKSVCLQSFPSYISSIYRHWEGLVISLPEDHVKS